MDEQERMIEGIEAVDRQQNAIEDKFSALEMLKKSLLQNLLTGKIRIPEGAIRE
jgi:restriction endonuclease S subunit